MATPQTPEPKRRRDRGDDGISWDKINKCYVGTISLGYRRDGKRLRRTRPRQDQGRGQGQARRAARRDQGRNPHARDLHRQAVRRATGSTRSRSIRDHRRRVPGAGREMDLSEDRRDQAQGLQGDRRRPVLQGPRQGARQALADDDQEHAAPVHPPRAEVTISSAGTWSNSSTCPTASPDARPAP